MKFNDVASQLEGIPYTSPQMGKVLYDFIMDTQPNQCLELGFAHGVSSCYLAAALQELNRGHLTSIDLEMSQNLHPSIELLLSRTGLGDWVTVVRERTGYNWFLKKKIEAAMVEHQCQPIYDFCFIDGAKNWTIDGFAFFLVDKLLRQRGWIVFDDHSWSYAQIEAQTGKKVSDGINHCELSDEERIQPHIEEIFQNLVICHPNYSNFKVVDDKFAYAQKIRSDVKTLKLDTSVSFKYKLVSWLKRILHKSRYKLA